MTAEKIIEQIKKDSEKQVRKITTEAEKQAKNILVTTKKEAEIEVKKILNQKWIDIQHSYSTWFLLELIQQIKEI